MGNIEKEPRVLDSQTAFFAHDLLASFRRACTHNDHIWAAKCLRHLGAFSKCEARVSHLLEGCKSEWRAILIDILFEEYRPSDLPPQGLSEQQACRMRWTTLADRFEKKVSDSKAAAEATANAKRSAENETGPPVAKTPRIGPSNSQQ